MLYKMNHSLPLFSYAFGAKKRKGYSELWTRLCFVVEMVSVCVCLLRKRQESENEMDQDGREEPHETSTDGTGVQSRSQPLMEQEGVSPPPGDNGRSIFSSGGRAQESQSARDRQLVNDERLRGVIHEVGTALTIIWLNAEVLERKISRKAASLSPLQVAEQQLDQEEDSVRQIVRQVQRVESLMTTIADGVCLPKDTPHVPSGSPAPHGKGTVSMSPEHKQPELRTWP
jgi:hypothetical protein